MKTMQYLYSQKNLFPDVIWSIGVKYALFLLMFFSSATMSSLSASDEPVVVPDTAMALEPLYIWIEPSAQTELRLENPEFYYYTEGQEQISMMYKGELYYPKGEILNTVVGVHESIEGCNRVVFVFNDFLLIWVMRPIMKGYAFVVPRTGRVMISGIARNIEFPVRMFSCFLQGRFSDGGMDFSRFLINTTLGGAGSFDVAKSWFDLDEVDEDFGQAFASWGFGPGCFITLPVHGPTTVRDGIGLIFDYGFDPKTWMPIPGVQAFCKMNDSSLSVDKYRRFTDSCKDPYVNIRDYWYIMRQVKIEK